MSGGKIEGVNLSGGYVYGLDFSRLINLRSVIEFLLQSGVMFIRNVGTFEGGPGEGELISVSRLV